LACFFSCKEDDSATPNPYATKILAQLMMNLKSKKVKAKYIWPNGDWK
jgi:hypothetical protein